MTHSELAKKIRDSIYERATSEGGAISREQMEDAIEGVLTKAMPAATAFYDLSLVPAGLARAAERASVEPGDLTWVRPEEWR